MKPGHGAQPVEVLMAGVRRYQGATGRRVRF